MSRHKRPELVHVPVWVAITLAIAISAEIGMALGFFLRVHG